MAEIRSVGEKVYADNSVVTIPLPEHQVGDIIIIFVAAFRSGSGPIDTIPAGYTSIISTGILGQGTYVGYIEATSSSMPNPVAGQANNDTNAFSVVVKDVDTTNVVDAVATDVYSADAFGGNFPSITTSNTNQLVFVGLGSDDNTEIALDQKATGELYALDLTKELTSAVGRNINAYSFVHPTASAIPTIGYNIISDRHVGFSFSLNNAVVGDNKAIDTRNDSEMLFQGGFYEEKNGTGNTFVNLATLISAINGETVQAANSVSVSHSQQGDDGAYSNITWSGSFVADTIEGVYTTIPTTDMTASSAAFQIGIQSENYLADTDTAGIVFIDSTGNWEAFIFASLKPATQFLTRAAITPDSETPIDSSGTVNWTSINRIGIFYRIDGTGTNGRSIWLRQLIKSGQLRVTGGSSDYPVTPRTISDSLNKRVSDVGITELLGPADSFAFPIRVGDGSRETHYDQNTKLLVSTENQDFKRVDEQDYFFELYTSSSDVLDFSSSITSSSVRGAFRFNQSSSVPSSATFQGWSCINRDVEWLSGVPCSGVSFVGSKVDAKDATFNNCAFVGGFAGDSILSIADGGAVTNSTFTKGLDSFSIEIATAGTYDFSGSTWSGYTTDINVTATSGTVTINLNPGQTAPTFATAGATVVINNEATVDVTVTVRDQTTKALISGAVVFLEADTGGSIAAGTVILNATTTASGVATTSLVLAGDQPVIGRVRKASASPFYTNFPLSGTITSSGFATTALMIRED